MDYSSNDHKRIPPFDLIEYINRLIADAKYWKLVRVNSKDDWYGNFIIKDQPYFLCKVGASPKNILERQNKDINKPRYIYCCGTDDMEYAIRDLTTQEAQDIYDQIYDYCSTDRLIELGFTFQG